MEILRRAINLNTLSNSGQVNNFYKNTAREEKEL